MLDKFFLITLGGSGEKLARYLKHDVEQRLRRRGWRGDIPAAWRWLCVDVAHASDVITNDVPVRLGPTGSRHALTKQRLGYAEYHHQLTQDERALSGLVGALPSPDVELPSPYDGAGQRPQIGNAVGLVELQALQREIDHHASFLNAPGVTDGLRSVSKLFDSEEEAVAPKTTVMVASSLGGGSGAGLMQLVSELVLNHPKTAHLREDVISLLFTPDIFADLTDAERAGVQANCLYTISTMLNGYHWTGEQDPALKSLFKNAGINLRAGRRAPSTNFFVGAANGTIEFRHQDDAIKAAARAIGRWLVDEKMAKSLRAHLEANRNGAPVTDEYRLTRRAEVSRPVSSLGYASISLGDSMLEEYATERLANAQLETFLRGHRAQSTAGEREDATVERLVKEKLGWFLEQASLRDEDILADLFDRDRLQDEMTARVKEMQVDMRTIKRRESGDQWQARISAEFKDFKKALEQHRKEEQPLQAERWRRKVESELPKATATSIGRLGALVTAELLEAARAKIKGRAGELSRKRLEEVKPQAEKWAEEARSLLKKASGERVGSDAKVLADAVKRSGEAVLLDEDAAYYEFAVELLRELSRQLLEPMESCVRRAMSELDRSATRKHRLLVEAWTDGEVPPRLQPAQNQVLLEPTTRYPALFDDLLRGTTGLASANALATAVEELLTGDWPRAGDAYEEPINIVREWTAESSAPAEFKLQLEAPDLYERARSWIAERPGAFSDRLKLPIAEWLHQTDRVELFVDKFEEALGFAMPLLDVNPAVRQRVHGAAGDAPKLHVSPLPLPGDSAAAERIEAALHAVGVSEGEINTLFDGTSKAQVVEISSFLSQPVEPVVAKSLFQPIQADWTARSGASAREQFSSFRRTRPLPLFVPISPAELRSFIRGWIVARLFGQLSSLRDGWDVAPLCVWSPEGWLRFPTRLLGSGSLRNEDEILGRLLESLPLAMASFATEQYGELNAYMRLIDLGAITDDDGDGLEGWVVNGPPTPDADGGVAVEPGIGYDRETPAGHRRKLLDEVTKQHEEIATYLNARPIARESVSTLGPRWEIGEAMRRGLDEIKKSLIELDFPADPDPTPSLAR